MAKKSTPVKADKKRTRPKKTEFEKSLERVIKIGKASGVHAIQTTEFKIYFTPGSVVTTPQQTTSTKGPAPLTGQPLEKHKVTAGGIMIDGDVPKEEILSDDEFLFMSTPFFQREKPLMNGDGENQ
jgi:hypothetical protein